MEDSLRKSLVPGARVTVIQQIPHRDRVWSDKVSGIILEYKQKPTGSWFAHAKDDRLWLDRLKIRRDNGELTTLNLDDYSHVEVAAAQPAPVDKPPAE